MRLICVKFSFTCPSRQVSAVVFFTKECVDRAESRWNAAWNDRWSLVLVNWFSTAANPLQPCLNSYEEIREKLTTCHDKFGLWANFIAVNFYTAGSGGGAFQAVRWLNDMLKRKCGQLPHC